MNQIDRTSLIAFLERMDSAAQRPQCLCVIGAAAIILLGQSARQTADIDIWRPGSKILDSDMRRIAEAAGLSYNPTEDEQGGAYLQIIGPGVVNLPSVQEDVWATGEQSRLLWQGKNITVVCPPPAIIAASKLVRASPRDVDDVIYLIEATGVSRKQLIVAADTIPEPDREFARENISLVDVMRNSAERRKQQRNRSEDHER